MFKEVSVFMTVTVTIDRNNAQKIFLVYAIVF